ncbi:MAG: siderophore biosynthesis protein, partial [Acinetobacter oleivorans]|nr:siderophore biosynthesis protein [Acinetobacter oleivorans]
MENYGDFKDHISYKKPYLAITLNDELEIYFNCLKVDGVNPFYVTQPEVLLHNLLSNTTSKISISEVFNYLTKANWWPSPHHQKAINYWLDNLVTAEKIPQILQSALSFSSPLMTSELLSLVADRPFHPFAHSKGELAPLTTQKEIEVYWWAFKQDDVINNMESIPHKELLLSEAEERLIADKMAELSDDYIALPLLETQHRYLKFDENKYGGIELSHVTTIGLPTSSLRTLIHNANPTLHLKLSTNAKTLGAIRSMPG